MLRSMLPICGLMVALLAGCANQNHEEPYTPVAGTAYDAGPTAYDGSYGGGYSSSNPYSTSGSVYGSTGSPTPQRKPGGTETYGMGEFSDYTEEQAQTWTTVSSDGSITTTNRSTGQVVGSYAGSGNVAGGGQTYVVAKGDTFYQLARRFYNDQARWRDIWNANRARVPNKDRLPVGVKLIIP